MNLDVTCLLVVFEFDDGKLPEQEGLVVLSDRKGQLFSGQITGS